MIVFNKKTIEDIAQNKISLSGQIIDVSELSDSYNTPLDYEIASVLNVSRAELNKQYITNLLVKHAHDKGLLTFTVLKNCQQSLQASIFPKLIEDNYLIIIK